MMRFDTLSPPLLSGVRRLVALVAIALLTGGCVTKGSFDAVVADRDQLDVERKRLEKQVNLLAASNRNLDEERAQLADDREDLRQRNEVMSADLNKLTKSRDLLSTHLRSRDAKLATTTAEITKLRSTYKSLVEDLGDEVSKGQIEIEQLREGIRVNLSQAILFGSGSASLNPQGRDVIKRVSTQLAKTDAIVEVQGHTDNVPITPRLAKQYQTNWELAGSRSTEVVRLLAESGIDTGRLRAVSYGPFHPIAPNDTPQGRAKHRRIEIRLTPSRDAGDNPQ